FSRSRWGAGISKTIRSLPASRASCRSSRARRSGAAAPSCAGAQVQGGIERRLRAGLRVSEVATLKVSDIDSARMVIRVEQGRKDRRVMLSPHLLELLRAWWKAARPRGWLFPGPDPAKPITIRSLHLACRAAARRAGLDKPVSPHTLRHS